MRRINYRKIHRLLAGILGICISLSFTGCTKNESVQIETGNSDDANVLLLQNDKDGQQVNDEEVRSQELYVNVVGLETDGDCTLIKCGDVQILIDSGSAIGTNGIDGISAAGVITDAMTEYMDEDGGKVWDYLIFTHPDEDHIGNAVSIMDFLTDEEWSIGTIIDYDFTEVQQSIDSFYQTKVAKNYSEKRNKYCENNSTEYFSAASLSASNLVQEYEIADGCTLSVLYNYFDDYDVVTNGGAKESFDSNYANLVAVCCLIKNGNQKLLFTGDLEEAGEYNLAKNHTDLISNVTFFKAGHHGSNTSNTEDFIDLITPAYVAMTYNSSAKNIEESINHFLRYTDYIYPSYVFFDNALCELFGNTEYYFDGSKVEVRPNFNEDNLSIFEACTSDGACWYEEECQEGKLQDFATVYTFDESIVENEYTDEGKKCRLNYAVDSDFCSYDNCTLIKYGHYDILVDCGSTKTNSTVFVDKLKRFVTDGVIECLIVTHFHDANISQLIGDYNSSGSLDNGVLDSFQIVNLIDGKETTLSNAPDTGFYKRYLSKIDGIENHYCLKNDESTTITISNELSVSAYGSGNGKPSDNAYSLDEDVYSLLVVINFYDNKFIFTGDQIDYTNYGVENSVIEDATYMRLPGLSLGFDKTTGYTDFIDVANPKYSFIGTPISYILPNGREVYSEEILKDTYDELCSEDSENQVFFCRNMDNDKKDSEQNGDLKLTVIHDGQENIYSVERVFSEKEPKTIKCLIEQCNNNR